MNIPVTQVEWKPSWRIIPSRFPPIQLFERVTNPDDLDAIFALESLTNPRLRDEVGDIRLVPRADRVSGPGSSTIMTVGAVSATRGIGGSERVLQMSTPIQPGSSGGPLLDGSGNIIGVVVASANTAAFLRASGQLPQSINFAVQGERARTFLEAAGVVPTVSASTRELRAPDIGDIGRAITGRIECLGQRRSSPIKRQVAR